MNTKSDVTEGRARFLARTAGAVRGLGHVTALSGDRAALRFVAMRRRMFARTTDPGGQR